MPASSNISPAFAKKNKDNFVKIEFEVHNLVDKHCCSYLLMIN